MPKSGTPLEVWTDFMGNEVRVGDTVIATRVPDRAAQMYSAEVLGIESVPNPYGGSNQAEVKIQVQPTGKYSTTYWYHDWPMEDDVITGKRVRTGERPKPQWIQSRNVLKYPGKLLDISGESE